MIKKRFYIGNNDVLLPVFNDLKLNGGKTHIEYQDSSKWQTISRTIGIIDKKLGENIIFSAPTRQGKIGLVQLNSLYDIDIKPLQSHHEIRIFPKKLLL